MSFEEITLKFVDLEDKDPLKQFLLNKINTLKPQVSILVCLMSIDEPLQQSVCSAFTGTVLLALFCNIVLCMCFP